MANIKIGIKTMQALITWGIADTPKYRYCVSDIHLDDNCDYASIKTIRRIERIQLNTTYANNIHNWNIVAECERGD